MATKSFAVNRVRACHILIFADGRCAPLPEIENAVPDSRLATNGSLVTYHCIAGHLFPGGDKTHTAYCDGISWNVTEKLCLRMYTT